MNEELDKRALKDAICGIIDGDSVTYRNSTLGKAVADAANMPYCITCHTHAVHYISATCPPALDQKVRQYISTNPTKFEYLTRPVEAIKSALKPGVNAEAFVWNWHYESSINVAVMAASCDAGGNAYAVLAEKAKHWLEAKGYRVEKAEAPSELCKLTTELNNAKKRILDLEDRINRFNQATTLLRNA